MMNVTSKTYINAHKEEQQKYNIERERAYQPLQNRGLVFLLFLPLNMQMSFSWLSDPCSYKEEIIKANFTNLTHVWAC